jgi:hypothetical protein
LIPFSVFGGGFALDVGRQGHRSGGLQHATKRVASGPANSIIK